MANDLSKMAIIGGGGRGRGLALAAMALMAAAGPSMFVDSPRPPKQQAPKEGDAARLTKAEKKRAKREARNRRIAENKEAERDA